MPWTTSIAPTMSRARATQSSSQTESRRLGTMIAASMLLQGVISLCHLPPSLQIQNSLPHLPQWAPLRTTLTACFCSVIFVRAFSKDPGTSWLTSHRYTQTGPVHVATQSADPSNGKENSCATSILLSSTQIVRMCVHVDTLAAARTSLGDTLSRTSTRVEAITNVRVAGCVSSDRLLPRTSLNATKSRAGDQGRGHDFESARTEVKVTVLHEQHDFRCGPRTARFLLVG